MQAFSGSTTSRRAVTTQALFGKKPANAPAKSAPVKNNKKSTKTSPKLDKARELRWVTWVGVDAHVALQPVKQV
jgi:hypothetical protein